MPRSSHRLTSQQQNEFDRRGLVRLCGLLPPAAVEAAREAVLQRLSEIGLWRDGAWQVEIVDYH